MAQVSILSGIVADETGEFRSSPPVNCEPVILDSGVSKGQLRIAGGAKLVTTGPGVDRAAIVWNGAVYRVMGSKLVRVMGGIVSILGDVGGAPTDYAALDYSFDRLAVGSGNKLWYYDTTNVTQVTDVDLGPVVDMLWVDGYFMTTDGTYVQVTELSDPYQVLPLKYGSAEEDPDMVTGLIKVRNEVYVAGRHTVQVYQNVGGSGFPFQSVRGATIPRGCVGPGAKCLYGETWAFVGSGRNEALGVHVAGQGESNKISDRRVDDALAAIMDTSTIRLECRTSRDEARLYVHLPDETWVFMARASEAAGQKIWYRATSGEGSSYRIRNAVNNNGKWIVGDILGGNIGEWSDEVGSHFGEAARWQFDVGMLYGPMPTIVHKVELVGLPGRGDMSQGSAIGMQVTLDGETFSSPRMVSAGALGARLTRMQWRPHVRTQSYMGLRFSGYNKALPGFARCEVNG